MTSQMNVTVSQGHENRRRERSTEACLIVHLDPLQRQQEQPPKTTLSEFFNICQVDDFARSLYYTDVSRYYTWNKKS